MGDGVSGAQPKRLFEHMDMGRSQHGQSGVKEGKSTSLFNKILNTTIKVDGQTYTVNKRSWKAFIERNPTIFREDAHAGAAVNGVKKSTPAESLSTAITTKKASLGKIFGSGGFTIKELTHLFDLLQIPAGHRGDIMRGKAFNDSLDLLKVLDKIFIATYDPPNEFARALMQYHKNPNNTLTRFTLAQQLAPYLATSPSSDQELEKVANNLPKKIESPTAIPQSPKEKTAQEVQKREQDKSDRLGWTTMKKIGDLQAFVSRSVGPINDHQARHIAQLIINSDENDVDLIKDIFTGLDDVGRYLILRALPRENQHVTALKELFWERLSGEELPTYRERLSDEKKSHLLP